MRYMNEYDRTGAILRFRRAGSVPNRLILAEVVDALATWTDNNSDGWAYWAKPKRAADRAMALIESRTSAENEFQEREDCSDRALRLALQPIKAFLTRQGVSAEDRAVILAAVI